MNDAIALSLRLSIGLVFLVAAFFKLRAGPRAMRQNAEDFGLKGRSAVLIAAILPPASRLFPPRTIRIGGRCHPGWPVIGIRCRNGQAPREGAPPGMRLLWR